MKKKKESFIFYRIFFEASKALNNDQKAVFFNLMCEYALNLESAKLEPGNEIVEAMFTLVKHEINRKQLENEQL